MTLFGKALRAVAVILALGAGSMHAKPAQADGGAIIAGVAGGLILGTIIGSTANANNRYYAPAPRYYAPRPDVYYAPAPASYYTPRSYYRPNVTVTYGSYYGGHKRYRQRGHGYRGHYSPRRHYRRSARRHYRRHH